MRTLLTEAQRGRYTEFRRFVRASVEPFAQDWEREQTLPGEVVSAMAEAGYLGATIPDEYGGRAWDVVTFGLLNEAFGRGSSSLTSVLTVQAMVSMAIVKWGTPRQRATWLPPLACGETLAAIALTEPGAGSDLRASTTVFRRCAGGDALLLSGTKCWITCGQLAGLFLVFGKWEEQPAACVVPRNAPGVVVEPIRDLMGFRAAGLARLTFKDVEIPLGNVVGKAGFALSHVAPVALHYGRISTACSALGLLRGCFEESIAYAAERKVGDRAIGELGMIRSLIARIGTDLRAASLLCMSACRSEDERAAEAFDDALTAKYFTSRAVVQAASDAVQIRGASGCHDSSPTSRYYTGAKIMEIIEGTTQIHEDLLGQIYLGRGPAFDALPESE